MKKKIYASLSALILSALVLAGCAASPSGTATTESQTTNPPVSTSVNNTVSTATEATTSGSELVLTVAELSKYDGTNGNPAYIAVDGVIYDVTNVPEWKNGAHNGFTAGKDLTDAIKTMSPHGTSKLSGVPVVGKLVD